MRSTVAGNGGSLWAATTTGRVFVSDNANAPAASVTFSGSTGGGEAPRRYITPIAVDPADANPA